MDPEQFGWLEEHFLRLADLDRLAPPVAIVAVLIALGIGAAHALAPGHGKAIIAAYLAGTRGGTREAVALGGIVAGMHSASVLVLGSALYLSSRASASVAPLMPLLSVGAGLLVLVVGVGLVQHQLRLRRTRGAVLTGASAPRHHHTRLTHDGHRHHALPPDVSPLSRRGVVLLGMSGGLLPSPSAFLVLTTAMFLGRAGFGLLLVLAFSAGLATTLTVVGVAAVHGRELLARQAPRSHRLAGLLAILPLASGIAVLGGGMLLTASAIARL